MKEYSNIYAIFTFFKLGIKFFLSTYAFMLNPFVLNGVSVNQNILCAFVSF